MELKLQYYNLSIRYHEHDNNYLEICRCYKAIYETSSVADDPEKWQPVRSALLFATAWDHSLAVGLAPILLPALIPALALSLTIKATLQPFREILPTLCSHSMSVHLSSECLF